MDKAENDDKSNDNFKTFKTKGRRESRLAGGRGWGGLKMYLKEYLIFEKIQNFKKRWTWVTSGRRQLANSKSEQ